MRIVLSGATEIGLQFIKTLYKSNDVTVIEDGPKNLKLLEKYDVQVINGNPTSLSVLQSANVDSADVFIACAVSDEVNVISCLAVKQLGKAQTFCFVNKDHYFETFAGELGEKLVIDKLIWPEKLLGEYIAQIIAIPGAIDVKVFEHEDLKMLEFRLKSGSFGIGKKMMDLGIPRGVLAVAVIRGEQVIIPRGQTVLFKDDKIIFMGHERPMQEIESRFNPKPNETLNVLIIGGGTVGYVVAKTLEPYKHVRVRMVEKNLAQCRFLTENLSERILVLNADGSSEEFLKTQQLDQCDCVVALTGYEEKNLMVSLKAKLLKAKKVITRAYSSENVEFFDKAGIDVAVSAQLNSVLNVSKLISDDSIDVLTIFEKGKAEIKEVVVPDNFPPTMLKDLRPPEGVVFAAFKRGSNTVVPCGIDKIMGGDLLRVFMSSDNEEARDLNQFFLDVIRKIAEAEEEKRFLAQKAIEDAKTEKEAEK